MVNRLTIIDGLIKHDWMNKSFDTNKVKCKHFIFYVIGGQQEKWHIFVGLRWSSGLERYSLGRGRGRGFETGAQLILLNSGKTKREAKRSFQEKRCMRSRLIRA